MSSTGGHIKAARSLREAESLALRKKISKASAVSHKGAQDPENDIFQQISDSSQNYLDKLEKLKKFKSKSKVNTKNLSLQSDWGAEQAQLGKLSSNIEISFTAALESFALEINGSDGILNDTNHMKSLIDENIDYQFNISKYKKGVRYQIHELKNMAKEILKNKQKNLKIEQQKSFKLNKEDQLNIIKADQQVSEQSESVTSPAVAIFADMLLKIKLQHTETSSLLYEEEKLLSIEVKNDNKKIISMLRDDRLTQETQRLRSDILHAEGGDGVEVELCIEEWLTKLANLDNSYALLSQQFAKQRASLKHSGGNETVGICGSLIRNSDESYDIDIEDTVDVDDASGSFDTHNSEMCDPNTHNPPSSSSYKKTNGGDDILGNSIQECDLKSSVDSIKSLSSPYRKSNNNDDSMTISSSSSTWNPDDHAIFTKTFRRVQLNGTLRKAFITTLRSHLPYKSIEDILAYEDWYRRLRSVINSQKDSASTYELSRSELITQAKEGIELLRASLADNMKRNNELHSFEKRRVFQHEKLLELRKIREEQDRIIAERHATVELEIQQKQREEELFIENQRAVQKVKVMGYKNEKELFIESQRKLVEEEKEAIDQEMKKEIESNRLKVQGRRDLLGDKESKKKLKEEEAEVADSRRLEALIRLAQQVPYFGNMQRVKANLAHLTASAKGHEYQPALEEEGRGHLPLNGFTDTKVISDARFRLATALRQAGVQHTDAAKHAVAAMHPRPQLSIHGIL
mmetsp:Transcript_36290/g.34299  ORF Transcript_36290/g.34299 Transcript_36290/m.34299 type:complete len:746 (+) Transcript_36290:142-2379(+)